VVAQKSQKNVFVGRDRGGYGSDGQIRFLVPTALRRVVVVQTLRQSDRAKLSNVGGVLAKSAETDA
jgi:hypothetical protein